MRGICWLAENRLASQEGLCSMMRNSDFSKYLPIESEDGSSGRRCYICNNFSTLQKLMLLIANFQLLQSTL